MQTNTDTNGRRATEAHLAWQPAASAWHGKTRLWTELTDVCRLLRINLVQALAGLAGEEFRFQNAQFKTGQRIYTLGQVFDSFYLVNSGFVKTVAVDDQGNEQVLGFPMKGDLFGIDGIHSKKYETEAVALSNCDIIIIPFRKFIALGRSHPELETEIYRVMSRELVREQNMLSMLGSLSSEARVARFLVNLSDRFVEMGYSGREFSLRMTRQEIGSYLGMTLETVSRTLSAFNEIGYISINQRELVLKDVPTLRTLRRLPPSRTRRLRTKKLVEAA